MAVENSGNAPLHLRTLLKAGAIGALSDGQLLERFANGRGEPREAAFAALVERHGAFVLRVCRSFLRDEHAAEDAFQATFLALARKAGSLWTEGSLAPWLHQAAYRAAVHDRSATIRRRSHEQAAAALRPESVAPPHSGNNDDLEKIIHEEIDRLPRPFRAAMVLCDLEGHTHEQAASHLGCAVGTVKSRLARGRKRLRRRLVRRGVTPSAALAIASAGGARAAVPAGLAESTVVYAATASAIPTSIAVITEGVLRSMFLSKLKLVLPAAAIVAALAAGAIALAQAGIDRPKEETGTPPNVGSPSWTYHILVSRDGEPPRKVAVVQMTSDAPIRVDAPGAVILFQPKRDGKPEADWHNDDAGAKVREEKTGRLPADAASQRPAGSRGAAGENQTGTNRSGANSSQAANGQGLGKIIVSSPKTMDVDIVQQYVCRIEAQRQVKIRPSEKGRIDEINIKEGQAVKKGFEMFKIIPLRFKAKADAAAAEVRIAEIEYNYTLKLFKDKVVSQNEVDLHKAKYDKALAQEQQAKAELDSTIVRAPFDGIVDRVQVQVGSFVEEGEIVTMLSDNSAMRVYFNVREKRYLEYMANRDQHKADMSIQLRLADGSLFNQSGSLGAIEGQFNNEKGSIPFRADFPNPDRLLRHGQSGTILISRPLKSALVIPQRATFELMDKRYVYIVDKDDVVQQRQIFIQHELDGLFVIKKGVGVNYRIVVDGLRQVHNGEKLKYEFRPLDQVIPTPKNPSP
jgi:membrane fusion protein (multidrug efflux system)